MLLALVQRGSSCNNAYRVVHRLAQRAIDERRPLRELLAEDLAGEGLDFDAIFDYTPVVRYAEESFSVSTRSSSPGFANF